MGREEPAVRNAPKYLLNSLGNSKLRRLLPAAWKAGFMSWHMVMGQLKQSPRSFCLIGY